MYFFYFISRSVLIFLPLYNHMTRIIIGVLMIKLFYLIYFNDSSLFIEKNFGNKCYNNKCFFSNKFLFIFCFRYENHNTLQLSKKSIAYKKEIIKVDGNHTIAAIIGYFYSYLYIVSLFAWQNCNRIVNKNLKK